MSQSANRKPRDDEIDLHALTHPGLVRQENQDHVLVTSLPELGGGARGGTASRAALEAVTRYVGESINTYYTADAADEVVFADTLSAATLRVHEELLRLAQETPETGHLATTLTLLIGLWPRAYLVQVGDSRYYLFNKGTLRQVSHDQIVGQDLADSGVLESGHPAYQRWSRTLSSSIGGSESRPVVTTYASDWDNVHLMCSDGLTRHVSDERIHERLSTMTSAKQASEDLLQDALDGGGRDNITMIVARTIRRDLP